MQTYMTFERLWRNKSVGQKTSPDDTARNSSRKRPGKALTSRTLFYTYIFRVRAVSSAGRAPPSHGGGHRFKSCTAHQQYQGVTMKVVTPFRYPPPFPTRNCNAPHKLALNDTYFYREKLRAWPINFCRAGCKFLSIFDAVLPCVGSKG